MEIKATVVEGARPGDLLAVALAPQDWPGRVGQPWGLVGVLRNTIISLPVSCRRLTGRAALATGVEMTCCGQGSGISARSLQSSQDFT